MISEHEKEKARIEKLADKWCTDNGYPVPKLRRAYRGTWAQIKKEKNDR